MRKIRISREKLYQLYVKGGLSQDRVAETLGVSRKVVSKNMKDNNIKTRPRYQYIASLRGENHAQYGKTWEDIHGKEGARKRKIEASERFRRLTIERIRKKQFPFKNTSIERAMRSEMKKRKWKIKEQVQIKGRFVSDFAIVDLMIECDGDFWHANPAIYERNNPSKLTKTQIRKIKSDIKKEELVKEKGLEIIRFFESDIKANVEKCVDEIEKKLCKIAFDKAGDIWEK